jgi:hypothetical protein
MSYTLFSGCSLSAGTGFELKKDHPALWVNQLHNACFSDTIKLNISTGGRSNAGIFQDTIKCLLSYPVEYAIVQWTSMPRYHLDLGFELYDTTQIFTPHNNCQTHNLHNMTYSAGYLNSIKNRLVALSHDCYEIFNLIEYVNTILRCARLTNTQIFFVNGLCPWDLNFFTKQTNCFPNQYTQYTQKLLETSTRSDDEVFKLYEKLHLNFESNGGIQSEHWLNLYDSMWVNKIDVNLDDCHPGEQSNNQYFNFFSTVLIEKISLT